MFGNIQGWLISAVLAVAYVFALFQLTEINRPTKPTSFGYDAKNLASLDLPVSPGTVVKMDQPGDAAGLYLRAMSAVSSNKAQYDRFATRGMEDEVADLGGLDNLIEATRLSSMRLFATRPAEIISYQAMPPRLETLDLIGKCCVRAGVVTKPVDAKRARAYYEAAFSLGAKLYAERITFSEAMSGLGLMGDASAGMAGLPKDVVTPDEQAAIRTFNTERADFFNKRMKPMWTVIGSIDQKYIERYAGDIFHFATTNKERMWRVESILKTGRYKFSAGKIADQKGVDVLLEQIARDPDPVIKAAVQKASDITLDEFKQIGS